MGSEHRGSLAEACAEPLYPQRPRGGLSLNVLCMEQVLRKEHMSVDSDGSWAPTQGAASDFPCLSGSSPVVSSFPSASSPAAFFTVPHTESSCTPSC